MDEQKPDEKKVQGRLVGARVVVYTVVVTLISATAFVALIAYVPTSSSTAENSCYAPPGSLTRIFVLTTVMFVAGALGGCLYNLRGIAKHSAESDYRGEYNLSYYLKPLSGGVCGVVVFFMLLGGALALNSGTQGSNLAWSTLNGRMPYIAAALLAGFASHEFMLKLKDIARALFALSKE